MTTRDALLAQWEHLHRSHLPALAKARDPVQSEWPVHLDHCFARIILDKVLGSDGPWTDAIKQPAVKHMNEAQFQAAIELGEQIAHGEKSLVTLDQESLEKRGKTKKRGRMDGDSRKEPMPPAKKGRLKDGPAISTYFVGLSPTKPKAKSKANQNDDDENAETEASNVKTTNDPDISAQLKRIATSDLTPFRKTTLSLLCQIPRGRYSTYQAMSDHITNTSHKTCARAVGNAMRNNPFAPEVPCHRVIASDGSLGGFKGHWGEEGKYAGDKHRLLHEEGVAFDSMSKVKGRPFREFV